MSRTVLVTGASRGIGRAVCDRLLADGHTVIGLCRTPLSARERFTSVKLDLLESDNIERTVRAILNEHPKLDAVVSNAGGPLFGHLEQLSQAQIERALSLNLLSHILLVRACLPHLKKSGGDIVVMGSEAAVRAGKKGSIYCAAKFGLRGFAQSVAEESRSRGVRVCLVHPGAVRTSFFDDQAFRPGPLDDHALQPEHVADAVASAMAAPTGCRFEEIHLSPQKHVLEFA